MKLINIEDSEVDFQLMIHHLKKGGITDLYAERVETEAELRAALQKDKWNIVISDYNIPGFSPLTALGIVRETSKHLPFIVVSGLVGEESVADMMKAGVEDFVIKSRLERLTPVIKRAVREFEVHEQEMKSRAIAKKALEAKEEMLAIVYHDIKNPLAAIQLDAQLLELLSHKTPSDEMMNDVRIQAKRILKTVDRLKVLVSDLLEDHKPIQDAELEHSFIIRKGVHNPFHVLNEVLDTLKPLIQEKNLSIKKIVVQRKMTAYFDKDRLQQVLANLLSNSLKFSPNGGVITIELEENESGDNIFSITDQGQGIPAESLPFVFDKYWTGGSGNGLGLYICKSIVESHGGEIKVESIYGKGAKFIFTIPNTKVESSEIEESVEEINSEERFVNHSSQNVYIIDDDDDLREVMTWTLEKEGYRVFPFQDGIEALESLQSTTHPPNLILLDFHMKKMNGRDFLNLKKASSNNILRNAPVVMVSAAPQIVRESIPGDLYVDILYKPLSLNKLVSTIHKHT